MRSRPLVAAAVSLVLLGGCEIEKVGIPRTEARLAVHAVLSASAPSQVVLLERTRNGTVSFFAPSFDLGDPIGSDAGIAESNAVVRLVTPAGDTLVAREDNVGGNGKGQGIYRIALPGSALARNAAYRLLVRTVSGEAITAETEVPAGTAAPVAAPRMFDRSRDSLILEWPKVQGARSYLVRIETPFGPRIFFTDSTRVRLRGNLRNVDETVLPRVFIPGFEQAITVSAVDSNFYDWYRTRNERLSGSGLINRIDGGFGVFGSLVRLRYESARVTAPQPEPVAGMFRFEGAQGPGQIALLQWIELYVESHSVRGDQGDALSGRFERVPSFSYVGDLVNGLLGTMKDGRVELALLRGWSATDTVDVFTGDLRGDTLVGAFRFFGGPARFVRQQAP